MNFSFTPTYTHTQRERERQTHTHPQIHDILDLLTVDAPLTHSYPLQRIHFTMFCNLSHFRPLNVCRPTSLWHHTLCQKYRGRFHAVLFYALQYFVSFNTVVLFSAWYSTLLRFMPCSVRFHITLSVTLYLKNIITAWKMIVHTCAHTIPLFLFVFVYRDHGKSWPTK